MTRGMSDLTALQSKAVPNDVRNEEQSVMPDLHK